MQYPLITKYLSEYKEIIKLQYFYFLFNINYIFVKQKFNTNK